MISDAVSRAVIEKEIQNSKYLTAEHFAAACVSLLTDKVDPQSRFRDILTLWSDTVLPSMLQAAVTQTVLKLNQPGQVAVAITGNDLLARLQVAIRTYE